MTQQAQRLHDILYRNLGALADLLADPTVLHISVIPSGAIWVERFGRAPEIQRTTLAVSERDSIIRLISTAAGRATTEASCRLSTIMPDGERFQAFIPPAAVAPTFEIRKRPAQIYTLGEYVEAQMMSERQAAVIATAIGEKANIIVSGGTGTGKTTLLNGLLDLLAGTVEHIVTGEDTPELQVGAPYHTAIYTVPGQSTMTEVVADMLRCNPSRIIIGEVRGPEALDVLDAWNTGHPGGMLSLHADPGKTGRRLESLIRRAPLTAPLPLEELRALIADAVHYIVDIVRTPDAPGRQVQSVTRWLGLDADNNYRMEVLV
jgi:type IV secretion system protein VirB11